MKAANLSKEPSYPRLVPAGDSAWTVEFEETIDPLVNDQVLAFARAVERLTVRDLIEVVPAYRSVTVYFDPIRTDARSLGSRLLRLAGTRRGRRSRKRPTRVIPVLYGGDCGPDLMDLASHAGLPPDQVVTLHTSVEYRVYMLGFSPGFPYLGTVPPAIAMARLSNPRPTVPAGSVGIAGAQTGIYPQETPGGWRLIGRTPLQLYLPSQPDPFLFQAGDRVRFVAIDQLEFDRLTNETKPSR
ncbi:MAG: 5-oxoprolinase subunit PxpB [Nitrospiraceae bacterium]